MAVKMIMEKSKFEYRDLQRVEHYRAYLICDTVEELPANSSWNGIVLEQGSVATVVAEGMDYMIDSAGVWKERESNFSEAIRIKGRVDSVSELPDNAKAGWLYFVGAATDPECAEYVYTEEGTWEHIGEGVPIEVDSALSTTSENPVQNKVITGALGDKVGTTDYATASTAGIVKPDGVTITVDADGTIHAANVDVTSWYGVRDIVRRGLASRFFQVGDQLVCQKDGVSIAWDIIGIDQDTPADSNFIHSMTLMTHEVYIQAAFDAKEALFAFDEGLAAGTYHFTIDQQPWVAGDVGKTVQFTLTNAIPAGGQLVINNAYNATVVGATISAFSGGTSTTAAETVTMSEGSDGTDLGSVGNALTGTTANSIQRALLGSNNWSQSAARQYLNSAAAAGTYWAPKTKWDRPPGYVASTAGFLKGLDNDFVSVLGKVTKTTSQNTVTDGGGGVQSEELIFLPSRSEIYGSAEISGVNEGTIYDYYKNATDADRIKYQGTAARHWWLRTPGSTYAYDVRLVLTSGALNSYGAYNAFGLAPACCIV